MFLDRKQGVSKSKKKLSDWLSKESLSSLSSKKEEIQVIRLIGSRSFRKIASS